MIQLLLDVWENSVKATHLFLSYDEIENIEKHVTQTLNGVPVFMITENKNGNPVDFMEIKELGVRRSAQNLDVGYITLKKWLNFPIRVSGNYAPDEQKEIARLKRELYDAQDVLDVLKKLSAF